MSSQKYLFLISDRFDEMYICYLYQLLKTYQAQMTLVSNRRHLVTGKSGLCIRTDKHLSKLTNIDQFDCLIVAEGLDCTTQLFSDPRVFELLKIAADDGKSIIAGPHGFKALKELPLWTPSLRKRVTQVQLPDLHHSTPLIGDFIKV